MAPRLATVMAGLYAVTLYGAAMANLSVHSAVNHLLLYTVAAPRTKDDDDDTEDRWPSEPNDLLVVETRLEQLVEQ